ncbi:hypothetical protein BU23DRAFT_581775 [Bimuria novae-zelandiae CBS 107.79]|uniref:Uncharacterized protein n=1 Tax=Bimuria novae-zelandiae CBS 107.79 TaxID=1447943 RepID=A0A6A5V0M3_9PLEO|nr:hypothetical protein BU23DRAFT_581775 [Bimuria novae-zelandiae CBS 107.79]
MLALPLQSEVLHALPINIIVLLATQPRKRGHLLGLRNKRKANVYITKKEEANLKLTIKLRNNRISNLVGLYSRICIFKSRLRVIMALAPMLAYPQLVFRYPEGTLLHVIKPLYRIAEAGELDISTLTYDLCFIVTIFLAHEEKMLKKAYYTLIIDASNMDNYKATLNLKQKG